MAELVGVAILFYVLGLITKVGWISDRIAPTRDWENLDLEKPSDIEKRARSLQ